MTTGINTSQWLQTAEYYKQSFDLNGRGKITRTPGAEDAATIDGQHISQMDLNVSERESKQSSHNLHKPLTYTQAHQLPTLHRISPDLKQ